MNRSVLVRVLWSAALLASPAYGLDVGTRHVGQVRSWKASQMAGYSSSWLQVKFVEESDVVLQGGRFLDDSGLDLMQVGQALEREDVLLVRPMINRDRSILRAWKRAGEERSGVIGPDLSLWFDVKVAGGAPAVARLVNALNALPCVEIALPLPIPQPLGIPASAARDLTRPRAAPPSPPVPTPDFTSQQGYLYDPPVGLNAAAAWDQGGGLGTGQRLVDLELFAAPPGHEDFDPSRLFYLSETHSQWSDHETSVLGESIGQHNSYGINGIAPDILYGVQDFDVDAFGQSCQDAIDQLRFGDAWVIEVGVNNLPLEAQQSCYDVIWTGVFARGISCVEAAGNSHINLDDPAYQRMFDRNYRDSGALMVAAGTPTGLEAESFTNYGSRIDVHGWGSQIVSTGGGDLYTEGTHQTTYTANFGGTSGAAGMTAGAALSLEGIARAGLGAPVDPIRLRYLLNATGTPHQGDREIGPRPDLVAAAAMLFDVDGVTQARPHRTPVVKVWPNPLRPGSPVSFLPDQPGPARLLIYNVAGRSIRSLTGHTGSTDCRLVWDGKDEAGRAVPDGVYLYRLLGAGWTGTGRVEVIR